MSLIVYAAFKSVPDYHAPAPPLKSLHLTLEGAIHALYPNRADFRNSFKEFSPGRWEGPDGFGMVERLEVKE